MIDKRNDPVQWALLSYQLEDAAEELGKLIDEMSSADDFEEVDFRIWLEGIYAHLNNAWNMRHERDPDADLSSRFPDDLTPLGAG